MDPITTQLAASFTKWFADNLALIKELPEHQATSVVVTEFEEKQGFKAQLSVEDWTKHNIAHVTRHTNLEGTK